MVLVLQVVPYQLHKLDRMMELLINYLKIKQIVETKSTASFKENEMALLGLFGTSCGLLT